MLIEAHKHVAHKAQARAAEEFVEENAVEPAAASSPRAGIDVGASPAGRSLSAAVSPWSLKRNGSSPGSSDVRP